MLKIVKPLKGLDYLNTLPTGAIRAYKCVGETIIFEVTRLGLVIVEKEGSGLFLWGCVYAPSHILMKDVSPANTWPVTANEARQILKLRGVPEIER